MGYLNKLIDRAVNENQENNQIGNYIIEPQHGNVYIYHIYKKIVRSRFLDKKIHLATIKIVPQLSVVTSHVKGNITHKESEIIVDTINNIYYDLDLYNETI